MSATMNGYNLDRGVLLIAGLVTLASVVLTVAVSPWWLLLTTFAGLNMLQASVTGFCPAALVLKRCGVRSGCAFR
ncbi:DUF2892 domain-containing protein [Nocardioides sp. CER19]|uniref:YgaP family membrane protein n=1 Tax=Nocardioides sp. CER19 TaxID=3038538 RepID=UPI00244774A0|nr:DUF2892 domain-containing protein [Nocardioides sp. CER19]MDH2415992.1 DUF2892 domain-containing protein [Nocardioides sp. CER19]